MMLPETTWEAALEFCAAARKDAIVHRINLRSFTMLGFLVSAALAWTASSSFAATWYVRPEAPTGTYGSENGTSYANAFNGLTIGDRSKGGPVWGSGGIKAGDTLYICGNHWLKISKVADSFWHGRIAFPVNGTANSPITIRGDYSADKGTVWGYGRNTTLSDSWTGPDSNGVYKINRDLGQFIAQDITIAGKGTFYLTELSATTWTGNYGAFSRVNGVTYVKTTDGKSPAGRLYTGDIAYRLWFLRNQYINFKNIGFPGFLTDIDRDENGELITTLPRSNHIKFDGCQFRYGTDTFFVMFDGNDYWDFNNCLFEYAPNAIYTYGRMGGVGSSYMHVAGSTFRHLGVLMFPHQDAHGIGIQRGLGHVFEHNSFDDTGTAIEFWTSVGNPMRNMTVRYNYINNPKIKSVTEGNGITISGDNGDTLGERTGFNIYSNIVVGAQGAGISSNNPDPITLNNNVIVGCATGIRTKVNSGTVQATVKNNIILNPKTAFIVCNGTGSKLNWDYNIYYAASNSSSLWGSWGSFGGWKSAMGVDSHSLWTDPKLVSSTPAKAADCMPQETSRAIDSGVAVGIALDFAGGAVPYGNGPDIGAYEYGATINVTPTKNAAQNWTKYE
ncbi:right-handed parallel beta-helix repeat-containing protein [bacterium]|nr:right-handed parallel beta-helix repeat-containing protein [bacterium]